MTRPLWLALGLGLLVLAFALSLALGATDLPLGQIWGLLLHPSDSTEAC